MSAHDSGKKLHDEDFMVQRESLVVSIEESVKAFAKGLWVVKELERGKIGRRRSILVFVFILFITSKEKMYGCTLYFEDRMETSKSDY